MFQALPSPGGLSVSVSLVILMHKPVIRSACLLAGMFCFGASANIMLNGTRVIYPASEKEVTVKITNNDKTAVLVQNWVDTGDVNATPETINAPFILTPPMNRIDPGKGQTMRLTYTGSHEAQDKETLFFLNVLEIPPIRKDVANPNQVQVAFRTRIKMFYRPDGLKPDAKTAAESIKWVAHDGKLQAVNDSPYYVTLVQVRVNNNKALADMVAPHGTMDVSFKNGKVAASHGDKVSYDYINDWGAVKSAETALQ